MASSNEDYEACVSQEGAADPLDTEPFAQHENHLLWMVIVHKVFKYNGNKDQLAEVCTGIFTLIKAKKLSPCHFFQHFIAAPVFKLRNKASSGKLQKFGHVLTYFLFKMEKRGRDGILVGIAKFCGGMVEEWPSLSLAWGNISNSWDVIAEVLSNAIRLTPGVIQLEGAPLTLMDFAGVFFEADKDTGNLNALLDRVHERLAISSSEQQENRIQMCIMREVYKCIKDKDKLEEACDEILKEHCLFNELEAEERKKDRKGSPSLALIFRMFHFAAYHMYQIKRMTDGGKTIGVTILAKYGHVLARCLLKVVEKEKLERKGRDRILKSIAKYNLDVVGADGEFCIVVGEVLTNAILLTSDLLTLWSVAQPTVEDFKDAFVDAANTNEKPEEEGLEAAKKNETQKPYALLAQVLKRMAEIHCNREKGGYFKDLGKSQKGDWGVKIDCEWIINDMHVDMDKLIEVLEETKTDFNYDLYSILVVDSGNFDLTSSDVIDLSSLFADS